MCLTLARHGGSLLSDGKQRDNHAAARAYDMILAIEYNNEQQIDATACQTGDK